MFKFFSSANKKKSGEEDSLLVPQRHNDGIIIISQNNKQRSLKIEAANMNAINLLGYPHEEFLERDIRDFLTESISDSLNEYIEFFDAGRSLSEVLSKTRRFKMKTRNGDVLPLRLRVVRSLSTLGNPRFQLVLNDDTLQQQIEANREEYRVNLKGNEIFDGRTGLLSYESVTKDLEMVGYYASKKPVTGTVIMAAIKDFDEIKANFGDKIADYVSRQIAHKIQLARRDEDILGIYDDSKFVVVLLETPYEHVQIPLRRIKWLIESTVLEFYDKDHNKHTLKPSVSLVYRKILPNLNVEAVLKEMSTGNGVEFV